MNNFKLTVTDIENSMFAHYEKAKTLKVEYQNSETEKQKEDLFYKIYDHEKEAEKFRRAALKMTLIP